MPAQWTGEVVAKMHMNRITIRRLAEHLGVTREYVGAILNGKRTPAGAEDRITAAVEEIIQQNHSTT